MAPQRAEARTSESRANPRAPFTKQEIDEQMGTCSGSKGGEFGGYGTMMVTNMDEASVSCTTFNILAPIYKRLDKENQGLRESQNRAFWFWRNQGILDRLLLERSSIICLQEVWIGNDELVEMYERRLGDAGYNTYKLARTNNRGDGLLTALQKDFFKVISYQELPFNDFGDRVAQILHVESMVPLWKNNKNVINREVLIVNTHLLFPHDYSFSIIRLHQVYMILQYIESYQRNHNLGPMPIILCGDWNGSKRGHVYKFLRSQGFVSSYDAAHNYTDSDVDAHRWVSHRNHRGNVCGVDFIWLLNPNKSRKPLRSSWSEAVFGIIKYHLRQASLTEGDAFAFFKAESNGEHITFQGFCQALFQLKLTCHTHGLDAEEIKQLWLQADLDGNGILDCKEFQRFWNPMRTEHPEERFGDPKWSEQQNSPGNTTIGFEVKTAALFPPEMEQGMWPENYSLSDHAPLTVVFSPRSMASWQPIC